MAGERLTRFSIEQMKSFTMNFHSKIDRFEPAYKGWMPNGVYVAVKMLTKYGEEQLMAELRILDRTYHKNIVRLIGYCVEGDVRALVYEYVPNGSLGEFLLSNRNDTDWVMLQNIAVDTAKGISYLHEERPEVIIHLDVKPSNILLDANFSPKLAGFGLAVYAKDKPEDKIQGSIGYFDPAYVRTGYATCKSDIYGFGMVLFDILGRYCLEASDRRDHRLFPEQVWEKFKKGILQYQNEEEGRMSIAALWCIQEKPEDRPSMSTVVNILKGDTEVMQPPYPFSSYLKSYPLTRTGSASISSRNGGDNETDAEHSGPDYDSDSTLCHGRIWGYFCFGSRLAGHFQSTFRALLEGRNNVLLSKRGALLWKLLPRAIAWVCWLERNARIFEEIVTPFENLIIEVKGFVWSWSLDDPCMRRVKLESLIFDWDNFIV